MYRLQHLSVHCSIPTFGDMWMPHTVHLNTACIICAYCVYLAVVRFHCVAIPRGYLSKGMEHPLAALRCRLKCELLASCGMTSVAGLRAHSSHSDWDAAFRASVCPPSLSSSSLFLRLYQQQLRPNRRSCESGQTDWLICARWWARCWRSWFCTAWAQRSLSWRWQFPISELDFNLLVLL